MRSIPAGVKWLAAAGGVVLVAYSVVMSGKTSPGETRPTAPPTATEPRSMTPAASPLMQPRVNCRKRKCVALTFDGGPGRHTARLLRILDRHDARVTFFLIGRKIEDRADLVRRMAAGGHVVGNHTWSHPRLTDVPTAKVRRQLRRTEKAIEAQTGGRSRVMRPPQGATDERISRISRSIGLAQILWDVRALDWRDHDTSLIARRILGGTRRDSIILLHDIYRGTVPAVPRIIKRLDKRGYTFVTVPELLRRPGLEPGEIYRRG